MHPWFCEKVCNHVVCAGRETQRALRRMYKILLRRERVPDGVTPAFIADELPPVPVCRQAAAQNRLFDTSPLLLVYSRKGYAEAHGTHFSAATQLWHRIAPITFAEALLRDVSLCNHKRLWCPASAHTGVSVCASAQALQHRTAAVQSSSLDLTCS